jgi:hypothetical protein
VEREVARVADVTKSEGDDSGIREESGQVRGGEVAVDAEDVAP